MSVAHIACRIILIFFLSSFDTMLHAEEHIDYVSLLKQDRNLLIEKYLIKYPNYDVEKFKESIDELILGRKNGFWIVGTLYEDMKDYSNARRFFKLSADRGFVYGISDYGKFLLKGLGGDQQFIKGIKLLLRLSRNHNNHFATAFLTELERISHISNFDTEINRLYWIEYFANKSVNAKEYDKKYKEPKDQYQIIAEYYEKLSGAESDKYVFGHDRVRDRFLNLARKYQKKSGNIEEVVRINRVISGGSRLSGELSSEIQHSCKELYDHRHSIASTHREIQNKILRGEYRERLSIEDFDDLFLQSLTIDNGDKISFSFQNISLYSALELFLNFSFGLQIDQSQVVVSEDLKDVSIMARFRNYPVNVVLALLLEKFQLGLTCEKSRFSIRTSEDFPKKTVFFTPHFITHWEGDLKLTGDDLEGEGVISYGSFLVVDGQIKRSMLNGKGRIHYLGGESLAGNNFTDNILSGQVELSFAEGVTYRGEYLNNKPDGSGEIFNTFYRYQGEFENGLENGEGYMENIKHLQPDDYLLKAMYPLNYKQYQVVSSYLGGFVKGKKHGIGTCSVFANGRKSDEFSCEFYNDNLISLAGISLLPPGANKSIHFQVNSGVKK